jgi:hypothetical protein
MDGQSNFPASGRYEGYMVSSLPAIGNHFLALRVDIDSEYVDSPVMNRISGDFYRVQSINLPGRPPIEKRAYQESWIVDEPMVNRLGLEDGVEITGRVRFWRGAHPATDIRIRITRDASTFEGSAELTFSQTGRPKWRYSCDRQSRFFRDMTLEVDVCESVSVNGSPLLASYDTHAHPTRPADLRRRRLTIEECYREAGIDLSIRPTHTVIDDTAPEFGRWSPAELHNVMEHNFKQFPGAWPKWQMWGLLAGTFDNPRVAGIMFDVAARHDGAGEPPERQGFAVFRNHQWFSGLVETLLLTTMPMQCERFCTPTSTKRATRSTSCTRGIRTARMPYRG